MAQLVVVRVARVFMAIPKVPLRVPPAQQVRDLPQARPHRLGAPRGTPMACRPATSPATVTAVRDSLLQFASPLSDVMIFSCHCEHSRGLGRRTSSAPRRRLRGFEANQMPYPWS